MRTLEMGGQVKQTIETFFAPEWEPERATQHVAESQWQYCMCRTCQKKRHKLDEMQGGPINYDTLRLQGERYGIPAA